MTLRDQRGNSVALGAELGRGGEASVFAVSGERRQAAKIFHAHSAERVDKLKAMIDHPPTDPTQRQGHVSICWPERMLFNEANVCVGFAMPLLDRGKHKTMLHFYNPLDRRQHAPSFTWDYLLRAALNISIVVESLHARGYVIGDMNESNFFISDQALVTLIDCDSMQVRTPAQVYRCTVAKPEYLAPELYGRDLATTDRTPEQDNFALAVLLFLMLMEGVHPFSGAWKGPGDPPPIDVRIRDGACPYVGSPLATAMPAAPPFDLLPASLRALFARAFGQGHAHPSARPSAREWHEALAGVQLVGCKVNPQHSYPKDARRCPWCERKALLGFDAFPDPRVAPAAVQQPLRARPFRAATARPTVAAPPVVPGRAVGGISAFSGGSLPRFRTTAFSGLLRPRAIGRGRIALLSWAVPTLSAGIGLLLYALYSFGPQFQFFWSLWIFAGVTGLVLNLQRGRTRRSLLNLLITGVSLSTLLYGTGALAPVQRIPLFAAVPALLGSRSLLLLTRHRLETAALLGRFLRAAMIFGLLATLLPSGTAALVASARPGSLAHVFSAGLGLASGLGRGLGRGLGGVRAAAPVHLLTCARVTRACGCESQNSFRAGESIALLLTSPGTPVAAVSVTWPGRMTEPIALPSRWSSSPSGSCKIGHLRVPANLLPGYVPLHVSVGTAPATQSSETGFTVTR